MSIHNTTAKLLINEILPRLKANKLSIKDCPITPKALRLMAEAKDSGILSHKEIRVRIDEVFSNTPQP